MNKFKLLILLSVSTGTSLHGMKTVASDLREFTQNLQKLEQSISGASGVKKEKQTKPRTTTKITKAKEIIIQLFNDADPALKKLVSEYPSDKKQLKKAEALYKTFKAKIDNDQQLTQQEMNQANKKFIALKETAGRINTTIDQITTKIQQAMPYLKILSPSKDADFITKIAQEELKILESLDESLAMMLEMTSILAHTDAFFKSLQSK